MAFSLNRWIYNKKVIIQLTIWFSDEENGCTICIQRSLTFLRQLRKSNQWYFSPADVIYTFLWVSISHKCQCLFPKRWPDLCYMTVNYVMLLFNNERSRGKLVFFIVLFNNWQLCLTILRGSEYSCSLEVSFTTLSSYRYMFAASILKCNP